MVFLGQMDSHMLNHLMMLRMKRQVALVLFTLCISTMFSITPQESEDGEFHLYI